MLVLYILLSSAASQQGTFFQGFIQGLRKDTRIESSCLKDIEATEYAATVYANSLSSNSSTISGVLHNFQSMVNSFTNAATVCKVQALTSNILAVYESIQNYKKGQYDGYAIYITTKLTDITNDWQKMQSSQNPYDKGYYFGLTFSIVFRYNI